MTTNSTKLRQESQSVHTHSEGCFIVPCLLENSSLTHKSKRQPILCGMLAFCVVLETQNTAVNICNSCGTVVYPANFCYAIKQQGYHSWLMMDQAISMFIVPLNYHILSRTVIHAEEHLFLGSAPKSIEESYKQFSLIMGYSASVFAQNRRRKWPAPISKSGPPGLKSTTVLGDFLQAGQAGSSTVMILNVHTIERLKWRGYEC